MSEDLTDLVVIEDNFNFRRAAGAFLHDKALTRFATDYVKGLGEIACPSTQRAIINCFFPYETDSLDTSLGETAIQKMIAIDETGQYIERFVQEMGKYVDLTYLGLLKAVRSYACHDRHSGIENLNPIGEIFKSLEIVNTRLGRDEATRRLNQLLTVTFPWYSENDPKVKDYFGALRESMQKDASNQPLGILIAEECDQRGIPFVLTTSTYRHDILTELIAVYCESKKWRLIDCGPNKLPGEKTSASFWEGAYEALQKEIQKQGARK